MTLSARTIERDLPEPGELVVLSVRGPVVTYPGQTRDAADRAGWVMAPAEEALAGSAHGGDGRR